MARPPRSSRAQAAYRRATWTVGALVVVVAAVVLGVLAVAGPSNGSNGASATGATVTSSQQLADLFAEAVPVDEAVGAIGPDAVDALNGVRPIVEVRDASTALLPRYVVGSADPGDGDAWAVQQTVQQAGSLELVVRADDADRSVLRIIRTSTEASPSPAETTTTAATQTTTPPPVSVTTETTVPGPAVSPPAPPSTNPDAPEPAPPTPPATSHPVVAGDSFWSVAEATLAAQMGAAPSVGEVTAYWHALVHANQQELPDPGNADLILPGMVLTLPTV